MVVNGRNRNAQNTSELPKLTQMQIPVRRSYNERTATRLLSATTTSHGSPRLRGMVVQTLLPKNVGVVRSTRRLTDMRAVLFFRVGGTHPEDPTHERPCRPSSAHFTLWFHGRSSPAWAGSHLHHVLTLCC